MGADGQTTRRRTASRDLILFGLAVGLILAFSDGWQIFVFGPLSETARAQPSLLTRTLFIPVYAIEAGLLAKAPLANARAALRAPLLWLVIAFTLLSTLWSIDPEQTGRRSVALLFTTLAGLSLAARYDWRSLSEVLATGFAILAVASLVLGLFVPSWGRMTDTFPGAWSGVWNEKNALGNRMALGVVIFLAAAALNPRRRVLWGLMASLCFLLIALSTSKTSLIGLALGLFAFGLVFVVRRGPLTAVIATFVAVTSVLILALSLASSWDALLGLLGKDATLTGRTTLWAAIVRQAQLRPWLGYGYGAVWDEQTIWGPLAWIIKQAGFRPAEAHDSWLDVWLALGYAGLGLFVLYFCETWVRAILALYRNAGAYLALPVLAIFSVTSIDETVALNYNDLVWVIFVAIALKLANPPGVERAGGPT
jgi:O-antigen ligase